MDILLAHAYFLNEDPKEQRIMKPYPPLGLLYLSSHLKNRGFDVGVFDGTFRDRQEFIDILRTERPPVVGLSCNMMTKMNALSLARIAQELGVFVVVGGPDPPLYTEEYLTHGADAVVVGEGEETLEELLVHLRGNGVAGLHNIRGLAFKDDGGRIVLSPSRPLMDDLDKQPFPDRSSVDIPAYIRAWRKRHGIGSVSLVCARGCPYTCTWCSRSVFGETHRRRSPENVADEVEQILKEYSPDMLWYADDVFTIHYRWLFDYADELKKRGLRIPFECISRADRLNEKVVGTLAEMGCSRLWIGSESGSQAVLDAMDRRVSVEQVRSMTLLLKQHGIKTGMFIMLGYEGEEMEDLEETVDHLKRSDPDMVLTTLAYPIKGTEYYDTVEDRIVAKKDWSERTDRDLTVSGRRSNRFYSFAARWMTGEVTVHKQLRSQRKSYLRLAKGFVNARIGRMGMRITSGSRVSGGGKSK